ncbi:hypothetical protein DV096_15525 [Bradymonadaceae bacterium TMQ3]|nr:hypothetical protein DV096_15525 [Bradymonadaceae bacterium TMQ3]TXC73045.1 hypothetical protein FRC91_16465 [Bradymonadales bacterium TMQ1]
MSETQSTDAVVIENLSLEEAERVFHFLQSFGYIKNPATSGAMVVMGSPLSYAYDKASKTLEIQLLMPSTIVTPAKIRAVVERERFRPEGLLGSVASELPAADNHVEITINNASGHLLVNSGRDVTKGVSRVIESRIAAGDEVLAIEARSATWSVVGAEGSVTYQIDAQTFLIIDYFLEGELFHQCSAMLKGVNAARYKTTVSGTGTRCVCESDRGPWLEMTPTVKIEKA